jgi:hypothetical protein
VAPADAAIPRTGAAWRGVDRPVWDATVVPEAVGDDAPLRFIQQSVKVGYTAPIGFRSVKVPIQALQLDQAKISETVT